MTHLNQQAFDKIVSGFDADQERHKNVEKSNVKMFADLAGNKFYFDENDKYHREDGPAIECVHGGCSWFVHGREISKNEYSELYLKPWWKEADAIVNDAFRFGATEAVSVESLLAIQAEKDLKYLNEFTIYLNEKLEDIFVRDSGMVVPIPPKFYTVSFTRLLHRLREQFQKAGFVMSHSFVFDDGVATPCFVFSV